MRILAFLFFCSLGMVGKPIPVWAAAGDTTYATHPAQALCGQTLTGALSSGTPIHSYFY